MPPKSKVKFPATADPNTTGSDNNAKENENINIRASATHRKKSKKSKLLQSELLQLQLLSEEEEEELAKKKPEVKLITFPDLDKDVSDGSISDTEIPMVDTLLRNDKKPCGGSKEDTIATPVPIEQVACDVGKVKLTSSQKISCLRSDNQQYATTDYMTATEAYFMPPMLHPLNAKVSSTTKHREYTEYLKNSGFLKMFGACILNVYRMWRWPPPEKLLEEMLAAMGYQLPSRVQHTELTEEKQALQAKLKALSKEKNELLKALDEHESTASTYELLDQDLLLSPAPEKSFLKFDIMNEIFKNMKLEPDTRDSESSDIKVSEKIRKVPDSFTLPIPYHDKRMLK